MYTHKRALSAVFCVFWLALAYSAAASISPSDYVIGQHLGIPVPVLKPVGGENSQPTHPQKTPTRKLPQNLRPTPYMSEKEKHMLAIALGEESRIDNQQGQHAMINVVLNRIGTTKHRNGVKAVLLEGNQFSFLWGDTKTRAGRILLSDDAKAIKTLASKEYADELDTVKKIVDKPHYLDVTNGRTYYYNPKTSSQTGKKWFADNVSDCEKIGNHHRFCYGKH